MTTPEEAIQALELAEQNKLTDQAKAMITHAVKDPFVRIWPEITGHERAVCGVATRISELLDLMCMSQDPTKEEPVFNALLAIQGLHAALNHLMASVPDDQPIDQMVKEANGIAEELRQRYARHAKLDPGDIVGIATVETLKIPIVKMRDPTPQEN